MSNYTKSTNFATKDNLTPGDPLKVVRGTEIDTEYNNIATAIATKTDNASAAITGGTIDGATVGATTPATGSFTTLAASGTTTLAGALVGAATQAAFNTTTTTLNLGGAATAVNLGAATGTATVNNTTLAAKAITASTTLAVTGTSTLTGAVTATAGVTGPITSSSVSITGGSITGITDLAVADGGTGASTAAGGLNNLLPSQTSNANKYLQTDGTNASWDAVSLSTADITGTLGAANGGTGVSNNAAMTVTGSGNFAYTRTLTGTTNVTFPTTGTLATLAGTETLTNKTLTSPILTTPTLGVATATSLQGIIGNVTPAAGTFTTITGSNDASISGMTVGKGTGAVATNTAVGLQSLNANTTGNVNTSVGYAAMQVNSTGTANSAFGYLALQQNTTGTNNTGIGDEALRFGTTASNNTAVGFQAGYTNTTGTSLEAFGYQALFSNSTGQYNSAFGYTALYSNTTGTQNNAFSRGALYANTTGGFNNAFGLSALGSNTTGSNNTAMGANALNSNTTASNNTAVGYQAGYTNSTGAQNAFFGRLSGYYTTGGFNTFLGDNAGSNISSGTKNTVIGRYDGNTGGLDIRTASNYIVLSDGDGNPRGIFDSSGNLIVGTTATAGSERLRIYGSNANWIGRFDNVNANPYGNIFQYSVTINGTGNEFLGCYEGGGATTRFTVRSNGGIANYSGNNVNLSDRREKTNFAPAKSYLDTICAIPVQTFNYIDQNMEEDGGLTLGVVAQDVQAVAPELVMESNWAGKDQEPKMRLSIYQTDLQYALMKAIQELKAEFDAYKLTHP